MRRVLAILAATRLAYADDPGRPDPAVATGRHGVTADAHASYGESIATAGTPSRSLGLSGGLGLYVADCGCTSVAVTLTASIWREDSRLANAFGIGALVRTHRASYIRAGIGIADFGRDLTQGTSGPIALVDAFYELGHRAGVTLDVDVARVDLGAGSDVLWIHAAIGVGVVLR